MKTKTKQAKKAVAAEPVRHVIDGRALVVALRKAMIPSRFIRSEVKLDAFPWGARMKQWLDSTFFECSRRGKSMYMSGASEHGLAACAMLTRSLVYRGHDAWFTTLSELMSLTEPLRPCEFLIIAGFWDGEFHKSKGCPLTVKEAYDLSWKLWRMANDGTTIVAHCSPSPGGASAWWANGALEDVFERSENLTIK